MSFVHWLVVFSALISLIGSFAYVRDTLKGTTRPNRVSWALWALAPLIGTGAAISAHADIWATTRTFLAGFLPLLVLIASFVNPQSYWKLTVFDFLCGAFSVLALLVWGFAESPRLAVLLAAAADGFAALPTIRKAWTNPETETGLTFAAGLAAVLLVLPSIPKWTIENSAFQVYLLAINSLILLAIYRKRFKFFTARRMDLN